MKKLHKKGLIISVLAISLCISMSMVAFASYSWGTSLAFTSGTVPCQTYNGVEVVANTGAAAINGCGRTDGNSYPAGYIYCHVWLVDNQGRAYNFTQNTNSYTTGAFSVQTAYRNVSGYLYYGHGYCNIYLNGSYQPDHWPVDSPLLSY